MKGFKTNTIAGISYYIHKLTNDDMGFIQSLVKDYKSARAKYDKVTTAELLKSFEDKYGFSLMHVLAYGNTDEIKAGVLHKIIEKRVIAIKGKEVTATSNAYKCFSIKYGNDNTSHYSRNSVKGFTSLNTIMHESYIDSWKCLLEILGSPQYVIIYKGKDNGKK